MSFPKILHMHKWHRHASQIRSVHHPFNDSEVKLVDYIQQCKDCGLIRPDKTMPASQVPEPVALPECVVGKLELNRE